MLKSVDTMLSYKNSSPASSRKRLQSSGTSSVSSYDIPKTPVDAYSNLHPGKLGKAFSVLKLKKSLLLPRDDSDGFPKPVVCVYALNYSRSPVLFPIFDIGTTQGTEYSTPRLAREHVL